MRNTLERPPRTIMEVYQSLPEGTLAELINTVIYMSPSPVYKHQKILKTISRRIDETLDKSGSGETILSPFDVYLDESSNAVQPDIIVILNENRSILKEEGHIHGVPDLLVEILSPGNKDHDMIRKKDLYEKFRVKEYWIVDPESKLTLGYALKNNRFERIHEEIGSFKSQLLNIDFEF